METIKNKTGSALKTIRINRIFDLSLEKVWKAWTDCESFKKWWGPKNYTCPYCDIDLKVGGNYLASMKGKDGKEVFSTGTYLEIIKQEKLVFSDSFSDNKGNIMPPPADMPGEWPEELMITVEMEEQDHKVNLSLKQEGIPAEMYEACIQGWQESFDKLEHNLKWNTI